MGKKPTEVASSGSGSSSDSESSSEEKKKKKKKDKKKEKKKKDKKKDKKKKKKDKKGKKEKKKGAKKKKNASSVAHQFGKFGIIKAEDFFNKKPEFMAWAMEVKKSNTDMLGQMQMKDLFKEYVEDYNTATMPSEKYYDLTAWDQKMAAKRQKKKRGAEMTDAQRASLASFDDESARKEEQKANEAKKQEKALQEQL